MERGKIMVLYFSLLWYLFIFFIWKGYCAIYLNMSENTLTCVSSQIFYTHRMSNLFFLNCLIADGV